MNSDTLLQMLLTAVAVALIIVAVEYIVPKIHRAIRRWWISGKWHSPASIQFRSIRGINGSRTIETVSGRPIGVRGFYLLVSTDHGQEMVSAGAALDRDEFWKIWKHLGGQMDGWVDEETGVKLDPKDF